MGRRWGRCGRSARESPSGVPDARSPYRSAADHSNGILVDKFVTSPSGAGRAEGRHSRQSRARSSADPRTLFAKSRQKSLISGVIAQNCPTADKTESGRSRSAPPGLLRLLGSRRWRAADLLATGGEPGRSGCVRKKPTRLPVAATYRVELTCWVAVGRPCGGPRFLPAGPWSHCSLRPKCRPLARRKIQSSSPRRTGASIVREDLIGRAASIAGGRICRFCGPLPGIFDLDQLVSTSQGRM